MTRTCKRFAALAVAAVVTVSATLAAQARPEVALRAAIELEESKGDIKAAIEQYKKLAEGRDRPVAAQALLRLANAYQTLGDAQARSTYERIVRYFGEQREVLAQADRRTVGLS